MHKSELKIIVVDDDGSINAAISEVIKKTMGLPAPIICTSPQDAIAQFKIQGAHLIIIDCLLPRMSGVDLAVQLRKDGAEKVPIVLMSGIYKDKNFVKDAVQKTKAINFLAKPFKMEELQKIIKDLLEDLVEEELSPLENLLISTPTPGEKIKSINQLESIEAYDIPWLCCLLMNPSTSGKLQLQNEQMTCAISFSQGKIVQVEMQNPESFFGALLIENGYLTPQQLEQALAVQSPKRVGERLVDLNLLSPHVIDLINAEQMANRLSKIITDHSYNVTFTEKPVDQSSYAIDTESLSPFLVDWINSKTQPAWLKQRYLRWVNSPTFKVAKAAGYKRLWGLHPLKNTPALVAEFEKGSSLAQILNRNQFREELVYQVFHLLILIEHIRLKQEVRAMDEAAQASRLQKLWTDMQTQDMFAVLGVARNSKPTDIKKAYHELAKLFHPDKVPPTATTQLKDLAQKVFGNMTKAYEVLSNDQRKATYIKELELGRAEKILEAESLLEEGKALLKSGQATKALEKFEQSIPLRPPSSELLIHLAWAKMMNQESLGNATEEGLMQVEQILNKIPPEDRHNATYYLVKSFFQKMIGDTAAAMKNVQLALSLNPKFLEAERLYRILQLQKNPPKNTDLLRGDLKDVVGNLFKKR